MTLVPSMSRSLASPYQTPRGDLPGGLEVDKLVDHVGVHDLHQPDDNGALHRDERIRPLPILHVFAHGAINQGELHREIPDGIKPEAPQSRHDVRGSDTQGELPEKDW